MPLYSLSFAEAFFTGDGTCDIYDMPTSDRPTNVYQAIISLPLEDRIAIARDVLGSESPEITAEGESFGFDVLDQVRDTNLCDGYDNPVTVYIDPDQYYEVTVYEEGGSDKPYFVSTD